MTEASASVCLILATALMYETSEENDGYKAMKFYIAKLNPKNDAFFQYPKKQWKYDDKIWYDAKPIGVNKLDNMMKSISEAAKLSKDYTNHSVRATAITLWSNSNIQNRHIMAISGHRSEQSLAHFNTRPSTSQHALFILLFQTFPNNFLFHRNNFLFHRKHITSQS